MGTHIPEYFLSDAFMGRVFLILFPRRAWPACADVIAMPLLGSYSGSGISLKVCVWGGSSLGHLAVRSGPLTVCVAELRTA